MSYKRIFLIITFLAISAWFFGMNTPEAKAMTVAELQALITQLQQQIAQLQQQLAQVQGTPVAWCHTFNVNLKINDEGPEVKALQLALGKEGDLVYDKNTNGIFDEYCALAVVGFQEKYVSEILAPWGLKHGTGFVGKSTRAKLNELYGCQKECRGENEPCGVIAAIQCCTGLKCVSEGNYPDASGICKKEVITPSVTVIFPNGGEKWEIGKDSDITWKSTGIDKVNIYARNLGLGVMCSPCITGIYCSSCDGTLITKDVSASLGKYSWTIPSNISSGDKYKIQIGDSNFYLGQNKVYDESDNYFSIVSAVQLQSNFFKNDPTAKSIIDGINYHVTFNNYYIEPHGVNTLSFEYKVINALRQLGYVRLTTTSKPGDTPVNVGIHKFQKKHNLPVADFIDKESMLLLDSEVAQREKLDKELARQYPPFVKFIDAPLNEPSKEHLAALYASFYTAMPETAVPDLKGWSIDEFRGALALFMGGNLGRMMNPEGTRVLSPAEAVEVWRNKGDFKFCGDTYYYKFRELYGGSCINPPDFISTSPADDFSYLTMYTHEYGHGVGSQAIEVDGRTDRADAFFGEISFDMSVLIRPDDPLSGSETLLRTENTNDEFVSRYAKTNNKEDFAESFTAYVHSGNIFRKRAESNVYLKQKYDFLKKHIFQGREYKTGSIESFNLWESENSGIPFHPWNYLIDDPDWVWDYQYPYVEAEPVTPSITVISPNGGEKWVVGQTYNITWQFTGNIKRIGIALRQVGEVETAWSVDFKNNLGSYSWTIPQNILSTIANVGLNSSQLVIFIFDRDNTGISDLSNNYFSIVAPTITCADSDGGKDYYTAGKCTRCTQAACGTTPDICSGSTLLEYYCENNECKEVLYTCPYGCSNGACIKGKSIPCDSYGDVNGDGVVTNDDANLISNYVIGNTTFTSEQKLRADVDQNGTVTSVDAMFISQYVEGTRTTFPACSKKPPCSSYGDVNGNGYVNLVDTDLISNYVVGKVTLTSEEKLRADVNGDGNVTSVDSMLIAQYITGTRDTFSVCGVGLKTIENKLASIAEAISQLIEKINELIEE